MNDTRVSALRVFGTRASGGKVEALLLTDEGNGSFIALTRPAKKLKPGDVVRFELNLEAVVEDDLGDGKKRLRFIHSNYEHGLAQIGQVPLPPYVQKAIPDAERYQTIYAKTKGSAAAPTAGLHFTDEVLFRIKSKGVQSTNVTLDVSVDTFRPISTENVEDHTMHGERCSVPEETANAINNCKGRVIAVGTTTVRTLESFASGERLIESGEKNSRLFITPGYEFKVVDAMFTNFHMSGTTLMLLVSAFAGRENIMRAYRAAIDERYRFLSFGDSMLIV